MRDIRDFKTKAFLKGAVAALAQDGFVTDEHPFAPYRDVVVTKIDEIQAYLSDHGASFDLGGGELDSPAFGPVYFIYDKSRLSADQASEQVDKWVRQGIDDVRA